MPTTFCPPAALRVALPAARPFVLLVDDHEPSLRGLCDLVACAGHSYVAARSGEDAQLYCRTRRPALVITDFSMPGIDGASLARWFRARHPRVPLFLVTGQDLADPAMMPLNSVFRAIYPKPIDAESILGQLDELMPPIRGGEAS